QRAPAAADAVDALARLGYGVLQIGDGDERGLVELFRVNQFADRALTAGDLAGNVFDVGNGPAEMAAVLFDEINQRAHQIVEGVGREALAKILNASGRLVEFGHDGVEVGLFLGLNHHALRRRLRPRRAKVNGNKILPHQSGKFNGGLAVRPYDGVGMQFHRDAHLIAGQPDFLDAADFDAGQPDAVAHLQVLHRVEQCIDVVAAPEHFHAAEGFDDDPGGEDGKDDKIAEFGFE